MMFIFFTTCGPGPWHMVSTEQFQTLYEEINA